MEEGAACQDPSPEAAALTRLTGGNSMPGSGNSMCKATEAGNNVSFALGLKVWGSSASCSLLALTSLTCLPI